MTAPPSPLDHALLGLLALAPASGYDLRKVLRDTPLGAYSDSPGSVYPALRRLETRGLVHSRVGTGGRRRRVCALTERGRAELERWLREPPTVAHAAKIAGDMELRLAFLSHCLPHADLGAFLRAYADTLDAHLRAVIGARDSMRGKLDRSARLALDLGIHLIRQRAAWCRRAARDERSGP